MLNALKIRPLNFRVAVKIAKNTLLYAKTNPANAKNSIPTV
jgi:hypothetical protein